MTLIQAICTPPRTERKLTLAYVLVGALTLMVAVVLGPAEPVFAPFPTFGTAAIGATAAVAAVATVGAVALMAAVAAVAGDAGSVTRSARPEAKLPVRVRAEVIRRMEE